MKESNEKLLLGGAAFVLYVLMGPAARITQALGIVGACVGGPLLTFCFLLIPRNAVDQGHQQVQSRRGAIHDSTDVACGRAIVALPIVMEMGKRVVQATNG